MKIWGLRKSFCSWVDLGFVSGPFYFFFLYIFGQWRLIGVVIVVNGVIRKMLLEFDVVEFNRFDDC